MGDRRANPFGFYQDDVDQEGRVPHLIVLLRHRASAVRRSVSDREPPRRRLSHHANTVRPLRVLATTSPPALWCYILGSLDTSGVGPTSHPKAADTHRVLVSSCSRGQANGLTNTITSRCHHEIEYPLDCARSPPRVRHLWATLIPAVGTTDVRPPESDTGLRTSPVSNRGQHKTTTPARGAALMES